MLDETATGKQAEERRVAIPRDLHADGAFRIGFRNDRGPNAVVGEVWVLESGASESALAADAPPPAAEPAEKPTTKPPEAGPGEAKVAAKEPAGAAPRPAGTAGVLIVTGNDYPGHLWRETAPALKNVLSADPRLRVEVVEDPAFLASEKLHEHDVVVLHFMNWETPDPGPAARENLRRFVDGGKGLVIVHFACGAFQDWPEFRSLAGRVYDPKLRGHDPHGTFRVDIVDKEHPIVRGLEPFETVDELYTCLAGDAKIQLLATSRSKVDGKDYPMAFVLPYGKGRVFHSPLGHDVRAFEAPGVGELFRRACAWAAGLEPVAR